MVTCQDCGAEFESEKVYANHVRWKHRVPFTAEGKKRAYEAWHRRKSRTTETVTCPRCNSPFERTFITEHPEKAKKYCSPHCAHARMQTLESKAKTSKSMTAFLKSHPEDAMRLVYANHRSSSKAERTLAIALGEKFRRHLIVKLDDLSFDVDIASRDGMIWIESDGEWHFRQVHEGHDFEATKRRDEIEEREAMRRGKLLIRVDNQRFTIDEQLHFINHWISQWSPAKGGMIVKYY